MKYRWDDYLAIGVICLGMAGAFAMAVALLIAVSWGPPSHVRAPYHLPQKSSYVLT